ncbi:MAG: hypothetical protein ACK51V_01305 [bacterium]|jgi:hypothetical protein
MAVPVHAECPGAGCPAQESSITLDGSDNAALLEGASIGMIAAVIAAKNDAKLLSERCRRIILTSAEGGLTTEASKGDDANAADPDTTLLEQFCASRAYAMAQQCSNLVLQMKEQIKSVSLKPRDVVLQSVSAYVQQSSIAPGELKTTAKVCLGEGFARNEDDVALSAALLLTALGDRSYSELIGYMLVSGSGGVMKRPDLALAWYELSLDGLADGQSTTVAPNMPDRAELIRKAAVAAASAMKTTGEGAPAAGQ